MSVAIFGVATESGRLGGIGDVEHDRTRAARVGARLGANCKEKIHLLVNDDVVASAWAGQVGDVTGDIRLGVVDNNALAGINIQKLK